MKIIAVDPGKMTGFATLVDGTFQSGQVEFMQFLTNVELFIDLRTEVVSERFVISAGTVRKGRGDVNWSIESIGALRFMCQKQAAKFELQNANDAMSFAFDDRLRTIGWWNPGKGHANDAARHMLLYIARHYPLQLPSGIVPP